MEYKYLLEEKANTFLSLEDIENNNIYVLCYNINIQSKYPFLTFMMNKDEQKEQLTLPKLNIKKQTKNINLLELLKILLKIDITEDLFKGLLFSSDYLNTFLLVNITGKYEDLNDKYFVLTSEIINNRKMMNIEIDEEISELFIQMPQIGQLTNIKTNKPFNIPDVAYTYCDKIQIARFYYIFGNQKSKSYENCGEYYYFYRSLLNKTNKKYLNRYAIHSEGNFYFMKEDFLTDNTIKKEYPEDCIIICNAIEKPDILVKKYEGFVSLSYDKI